MRGKQVKPRCITHKAGITPADAGKTLWDKNAVKRWGDHPRGCGENYGQAVPLLCSWGSPPRMRGKLHSLRCVRRCQGITPADAGKTRRLNT